MPKDIHIISRAVILKNGKVLVCENKKKHFYYLPGGHVDEGETAVQALERELEEELQVSCIIGRFLGCFEYSFGQVLGKCHNQEINFLFMVEIPRLASGVNPPSAEEDLAFRWILLSELEVVDFKPHALVKFLNNWLVTDYHGALVTVVDPGL